MGHGIVSVKSIEVDYVTDKVYWFVTRYLFVDFLK